MIEAYDATHAILHKDTYAYSAHPQVAVAANGDWLVVFNRAPRRPFILHPPEDPLFRNLIMRSRDHGRSWSAPEVVPTYDWSGTECASLTTLRDGRMMLNQWRFRWYPLGLAQRLRTTERLVFPAAFLSGWARSREHDAAGHRDLPPEQLAPWARGGGETVLHFSDDHGASWTRSTRINTAPYDGGYGMRGACELANGDLLLPLSDVPNYRVVFVVRSGDGGRSWEPASEAARREGSEFEEPSLIQLPGGRLLMLLRDNGTRRLHRCVSDDGRAWSAPVPLPIEGYPPHLLLLPDGRVLCTYGWRQPDYGIRAVLSADGGETWDVDGTIRIRSGLPNKDLGYPSTLRDRDGSLFTLYYGQDGDGVTCIWGTRWRL